MYLLNTDAARGRERRKNIQQTDPSTTMFYNMPFLDDKKTTESLTAMVIPTSNK